jgi:hypothetical protein
MLSLWAMGMSAGFGNEIPNKSLFIALYTLSVAFYMPTLALTNTTAFTVLKNNGGDTVTDFPPIRSCGTVGFIIVMWFVNCAVWDNGSFSMTLAQNAHKFQYTYNQFFVSGILSLVMFFYVFTLPQCRIVREANPQKKTLMELFGLDAFKLFKERRMALFFIFSALLGMSLQVTNSFAGPFHLQFPGQQRPCHRLFLCSKQCHVADVHLSGQRGLLHSAHTFLPQALWYQERYAYRHVRMGPCASASSE